MELCEKKLDFYVKFAKKPNARVKKTAIDPWKVWDMKHKQGMNLLQITRKLFSVHGNPNYDFDEKLYKQTKRAYKKASEIMTHIKPNEKASEKLASLQKRIK
jgi:hypothetical protein